MYEVGLRDIVKLLWIWFYVQHLRTGSKIYCPIPRARIHNMVSKVFTDPGKHDDLQMRGLCKMLADS